jgi:hypothetical protein
VHHIRVEQWCVLWDDSNRFPHTFEGEIVNRLPINEDSARAWCVESIEESEDSGLSTSRRTDYGHFLSGGDGEGDVFEDETVWMISEVDLVKSDGAALQTLGLWLLLCPVVGFNGG